MAAGDVSEALLARVRSRINEPSAGEWEDSEIYSSLTRGQVDLVSNQLADGALAGVRKIMSDDLVATQSAYDLPTDFLRARYVLYKDIGARHWLKRFIAALGEGTAAGNVHVAPSETNPFYYFHADQLVFAVGAVTQADSEKYKLFYIRSPVDITASVDPEIATYLHGLLVEFAVSRCREQSRAFEEAADTMAEYMELCSLVNSRYRGTIGYDGPGGDPSVTFQRTEG